MSITADQAFSWVLIASLAASLFFGAVSFGGSLWKFVFAAVNRSVYIFAVFGIVLLTSPKWTDMVVNIWGIQFELSRLREANTSLEAERTRLASEATSLNKQVAAVEADRDRLAGQTGVYVAALDNAKAKVSTLEKEREQLAGEIKENAAALSDLPLSISSTEI